MIHKAYCVDQSCNTRRNTSESAIYSTYTQTNTIHNKKRGEGVFKVRAHQAHFYGNHVFKI